MLFSRVTMMHTAVTLIAFGLSSALPPNVETIEIAPGVQMPVVSLGTARGCPPNATAIKADIPLALSLGFGGIDTAHNDFCYNDTAVGEALKGVDRKSYFITQKIASAYSVKPEDWDQHLEDSLTNLGLDYVDLLLVHHPGKLWRLSFEESLQQQWAAMEKFYKAGKARALGVSNYCKTAMEIIMKNATVKPAVNQVLYHAGMGDDADGVVSYAREHNITIMAFSPTDEGNPLLLSGEPYKSIGATHGKSAIQASLRWLVQKGFAFIVASEKKAHLQSDFDVFDFKLSDSEMANISSQVSCKAGGFKPPQCLPYWPGQMNCCSLDTKGTQCPKDGEVVV